jgi:Glyoxalase-like domain
MELTNITFDAVDPERLAAFWAAATGGGSPRPPPTSRS